MARCCPWPKQVTWGSPNEELHPSTRRPWPGLWMQTEVPVLSAVMGVGGLQSFEKYDVLYFYIVIYLVKQPAGIPA